MKRIQRELEFQLVCLNLIKQGQGPIAQENVPSGEERGARREDWAVFAGYSFTII